MTGTETRVPPAAGWLGGLGAVPFVALAAAVALLDGPPRGLAVQALAAYGAVILSFLGGIHWGLAIATPAAGETGSGLTARLAWSVVPSLAGWAALLVPPTIGLFGLAAAFAAMLGFDLLATRAGDTPAWYPRLRIPLTLAVVGSLLLAASGLRMA